MDSCKTQEEIMESILQEQIWIPKISIVLNNKRRYNGITSDNRK